MPTIPWRTATTPEPTTQYVVLASTLGAAFSARRIVRMRAVEILRME